MFFHVSADESPDVVVLPACRFGDLGRCRAFLAAQQFKDNRPKLEQQRIDHLVEQADAMHRAGQIRTYVAAVHEANKTARQPMTAEELNSWTEWALAQADRIDPVVSGIYKTRPPEPEE